MKKTLKFIKEKNISKAPISYQFLGGLELKKDGKFSDFPFAVDIYRSRKCYTVPFYKPLSKIIRKK